jgi:hypothetical protein
VCHRIGLFLDVEVDVLLFPLADARVSLGRALVAVDKPDAARDHLTAALETYESRGADRYAAPVRELLEVLDGDRVDAPPRGR